MWLKVGKTLLRCYSTAVGNGDRSNARTPAPQQTAGNGGFPWRPVMLCDERLMFCNDVTYAFVGYRALNAAGV